MVQPIVSIILTSYNKPNTIGNAIESVINQTRKDWELFIMDDASDDATLQIIKTYVDDERITVINSNIDDDKRYMTTRYATLINEAIPKTKGKYISYLTDDTTYISNRLEMMIQEMESNPTLDVVYSSQKVITLDHDANVVSEKTRYTKGILTNAANVVDHCSVMHTRKIADSIYKRYDSYWDDDPIYWHNGDAAFWTRLNQFSSFYPINSILDISYKSPYSFQNLNEYLPKELPDGVLVKGYLSDVYLIENNMRRKIDEEFFPKLRFDKSRITEIPDPNLYKYKMGPNIDQCIYDNPSLFPNGRLVSASNNNEIYYIQEHKKRLIFNQHAFDKYHFSMEEVIELEIDYLNQFEEGPIISNLLNNEGVILPNNILFTDSKRYFLSQNNYLHEIDKVVLNKLKIKEEWAVRMTNEERLCFPKGNSFQWTYYKSGGKKGRNRKKKISTGSIVYRNRKTRD
ncbi:glycosyltransferase family 2 protein [Evansella sp. AB-rgal1]|uniref:glycosyltransferase family 2 protein n=1 Tax=Evansella sp. AB-rgal1 TaxID=3242696 RepID=UPI00359EAD74